MYEAWAMAAAQRGLTIVRPTVVFGPDNRGNVYKLLEQVARGRNFVIGGGRNRKSMAYVENVADFLVYTLRFDPGVHVYNYIDKPDMDMSELVSVARSTLGKNGTRPWRIPYGLGLGVGLAFDLTAKLTGVRFPISAIRVRKYGATTQFGAFRVAESGFVPRHDLRDSLVATIWHEFGPAVGPVDAHRRANQT